jgi:hypothetical protein
MDEMTITRLMLDTFDAATRMFVDILTAGDM